MGIVHPDRFIGLWAEEDAAIVAALRLVLLDAAVVVNPNQTVTITAIEAPWLRLMALMEARR
jgi:hypothetical protein